MNFYPPQRAFLSTLGFFLYFSGTLSASAQALNVSQLPLMLNETVAPNLILTLDDSSSMDRAYVPDSIPGGTATRRYKSAHYNPMYYNPAITYKIPPRMNADGSTATPFDTDFNKAWLNGFNTGRGSLDLSNSYRPASTYTVTSTSQSNANNPEPEFYLDYTHTVTLTAGATSNLIHYNSVSFRITRNSSSSSTACSVAVEKPANYPTISCVRSNNSYRLTITNRRTSNVPAYYYIYDDSLANCPTTVSARRDDDNCYRKVDVSSTSGILRKDAPSAGTDERKNFAIWYSFYRTRGLATISAASIAFAELPANTRLTWQGLTTCTTLDGTSCNGKDNRFREYNPAQRGRLFDWMQSMTFPSTTPLRQALDRAGKFLQTEKAWQKFPNATGNTTANTYSCRPSYHILMTDGMWNGNNGFPTGTLRSDHSSFSVAGMNYDGTRAPYADKTEETLADLAMHYWATDLNTNLENKLRPYIPFRNENDAASQFWDPRNNPATWQHMVNFTMGLGLTASLNQAGLEWDPEKGTFGGSGYTNLAKGADWPPASGSGSTSSPNNVYDLWHAAINSRGEFFSVDTPEAMVQAFTDILSRINDRTTTAARPAVSASFVSDNDGNNLQSNVYATQFSSEDWSGQLSKTLVSANGQTTELWNIQTANQSLDPVARRVMMAAPSNVSNGLKSFIWSNLGTLQSLLNIDPDSLVGTQDNRGEQRVAYIRGERSGEGDATPAFRKRNNRTVMGDIINSSPAVVGTPAYLAYLADAIENPLGNRASYKSYAAFRETYQKSSVNNPDGRTEMIYVGGNDGMLHGFNAATGREEFSFIPTEVIKNLYRLTGQNYSGAGHRYFVDGSPVVRDVYFGDDEGWRTVLIGTLRAGGRALFALDVTDPTQIKLLWEFGTTQDSDLGFTFAQPEIVRLHTGQWAVLQGNGYDSTDDKAALLVIDIKSGDLIRKIPVPDTLENNVRLPNGLSSVRGADNNGDGLVDYAYAGDLQGNLWRFDLVKASSSPETPTVGDPFARTNTEVSSTTKDDFKLAYGDRPLFVARDKAGSRQAITIQPSLVRHPSGYGYLVLMGTGKYFEASDANVDTSRAMTLYGIWDRNTKRQSTTASTPVAGTRTGRLVEQSFTEQQNNVVIGDEEQSATRDIRLVSQEIPQWFRVPTIDESSLKIPTSDALVTQWGWALDMAVKNNNGTPRLEGEMIINNMTASGSILFLSSLTPNQDPCQAGADTWLYAVDAFSGGRTRFNVLDLNADRLVNPTDAYNANVVSGMRFPALGGFTLAPGNKVFGSDGAADPATVGDDPNSSGRQSWHIVPEEFQ
ncbi:pilus assembly protein [Ectopseudomonas chengduensis]